MSELDKEFESSVEIAKLHVVNFSNDQKLNLYKYYKQLTIGDNNTNKPSFLNLKAKEKWKAWDSVKGVSKEDATKEYIKLVKKYTE